LSAAPRKVGAATLLFWPLRPLWRLVLRAMPVRDPWERINHRVAATKFGPGSTHDFAWYFEGASSVAVSSLDDVQEWLLGCHYETDPELFQLEDFWQHPQTFEQIRRGDCEDHAVWAWRKLVELGYDADLVLGRCLPWAPGDGLDRTHVWVVFRRDGESFLFETTAKERDRMVHRLATVAATYRPELGVDRHRKSFGFYGAVLTARDRELAP
jgi:hypothetical protein